MSNPNEISRLTDWDQSVTWEENAGVPWKVNTLLNDEFKEFVKSIDTKWLWERPKYDKMNSKEKISAFLKELNIFITFTHILVQLWKKREDITRLLNHDVQHTFTLQQTKETIEYLSTSNPDYLEANIDEYIKNIDSLIKIFLSFIESLYFVLNLENSWIEPRRRTIPLWELIDLCKWDDSYTIKIELATPNIEVFGIVWDIVMFIKNIISNAKKHNPLKAWILREEVIEEKEKLQIIITSEKKWSTLKIVIADNGKWIPEDILPHIFESGRSGWWSTGLWLRDLEKRWIIAKASNDGLTNTQWWKWARFEIDLPIKE